MKKRLCNLKIKEKNGKLVMSVKGYCQDNPNKHINRDIVMDMEDIIR